MSEMDIIFQQDFAPPRYFRSARDSTKHIRKSGLIDVVQQNDQLVRLIWLTQSEFFEASINKLGYLQPLPWKHSKWDVKIGKSAGRTFGTFVEVTLFIYFFFF